jgi:phosphoribosylanthranilate isomerase
MNVRTRVKICGCTSVDDVATAVEAGADAVGVIFAESPRQVTLAQARAIVRSVPPFVAVVGVMVNPSPDFVAAVLALGCVPQFSGDETPEFCSANAGGRYVKALHFERFLVHAPADAEAAADRYPEADLLFDSRGAGLYGGTGATFSWPLVEGVARRRRIIMSGGLTPDNVATCVKTVRPFAVDVRSGVETRGVKDRDKMRAFVRAVREIDEGTSLAET